MARDTTLRSIHHRSIRRRSEGRHRLGARRRLLVEPLENRRLLAGDHVMFVDSTVWNEATGWDGLYFAESELVVLDPDRDGVQQIADYLSGREEIDVVELVTHGDFDALSPVGDAAVRLENLSDYKEALATIGDSMSADGDILLWGCGIVGAEGRALVDAIASATGADVAASDDTTGPAERGGNWELEYATGPIEATGHLPGLNLPLTLSHRSIEEFTIRLVSNFPPLAKAGDTYSVFEGETVLLDGTHSSDTDGAIVSYEWDLDYDGQPARFVADATTPTAVFDAAMIDGPASFNVALRVTDNHGVSTVTTAVVDVANRNPQHLSLGGDLVVDEGATPTITATFTDVPGDTITEYVWRLTDSASGVLEDEVRGGSDYKLPPTLDEGDYVLTVRLVDDDGGVASTSISINVKPAAPVLLISGQPHVDEGSNYRLNLSASVEAHTISNWFIDWGDGSDPDGDGATGEVVIGSPEFVDHVYADGTATHTIRATATDQHGTYRAEASGNNSIASADPQFGEGGEVRTDFFGSTADYARAVTLTQPDGKLLVAGYTKGGNNNIGLARYHADGTPDNSFGIDGRVLTDFGSDETTEDMLLDHEGRILVAGNFGVARYTTDGVLDGGFGADGALSLLTGVRAMALDGEQRLLLASGSHIARVLPDGSADHSFANGGAIDVNGLLTISDIVVDTAGRVTATGHRAMAPTSDDDIRVVRYTSDGRLDVSFGTGDSDGDGVVTIDYGGRHDQAVDLALHDNGRDIGILIGGTTDAIYNPALFANEDPSGNDRNDADIALIRLLGDGTFDASFGGGTATSPGQLQTHIRGWEYVASMAVTSNNEILIGGENFGWARYTPNGMLDTTINASTSYAGRADLLLDGGYSILEDASGNIVTGGHVFASRGEGWNFAVARQFPDGSVDSSFGTGGLVTTNFEGSTADHIQAMAHTDSDGKVLVAGYKSGASSEMVLARYLPDGSLDPSFGNGEGVVIDPSGSYPEAIAVDPVDGKILLAIHSRIWRYNADGSADLSFGPRPWDNSANVYGHFERIQSLVIDDDGKIVVGGSIGRFVNGIRTHDFAIARYHSVADGDGGAFAGALDLSFSAGDADGVDGIHYLDLGSHGTQASHEFVSDITLDDQGRVVAAGYSYTEDVSSRPSVTTVRESDFALLRLTPQGRLDAEFGAGVSQDAQGNVIENLDGVVLTDFGSSEMPHSVRTDSQGRIVVGGGDHLARYRPDGTADLAFDDDGRQAATSIHALAIDEEDGIVVGGSTRLGRYRADGTADKSFGPSGYLEIFGRAVHQVAIDSTGRIVVSGNTDASGSSGTDFWVSRYVTGGLSVTVNNVEPQDVAITGSSVARESELIHLTATASDPAASKDPLLYTWSITGNDQPFLRQAGKDIAYLAADNGSYQATLTVDDGDGGVVTAIHTTTVVNEPPVALQDVGAVSEDGFALLIDVLANDSDPAGALDPLTITEIDASSTRGLVTLTPSHIFYEPDQRFETMSAGATFTDVFRYTISDGDGGFATADVAVIIAGANDEPTAADATLLAEEDGVAVVTERLTADIDSDDRPGTLVYTILDDPYEGLVTSVGDGAFQFDPGERFQHLGIGETHQLDVSYTATDRHGAVSSPATLTILIAGNNDPPQAKNLSRPVTEGSGVLRIDLNALVEDPDEPDLPVITELIQNGGREADIESNEGLLVVDTDRFRDLAVGESETLTFTYTVDDQRGVSNSTATGIITLTIIGRNDQPTAVHDSYRVPEDGVLTLDAGGGVLGNDSDIDTDLLKLVAINGSPIAGGRPISLSHGRLEMQNDGSFAYHPSGVCDVAGTRETFAYTVSDGRGGSDTATVEISITPAVAEGASSFAEGVFRIAGTASDDDIVLRKKNGILYRNGSSTGIAVAEISEIRVWGRGGDDTITIDGLRIPSLLHGGEGDDSISGGSARDLIFGAAGSDRLTGGAGDDFLAGGQGLDRLVGAAGNDILLADSLLCSTTRDEIESLFDLWSDASGGRDDAAAVDILFSDSEKDRLTGSAGADWFILGERDEVTDLKKHKRGEDRVSYL